eukprot:NODE_2019_length_1716_cov_41.270559_g1724_i0.p1 GENE.NODE_2019_length_1716_cov_41.270559_g1724_i0~~NODE_2019_length_1716_cov_41.270559_g1724_i0.p1  ORF type:complete len:493 (-),score=56.45 NODE_2019_length_1716_cov_41.270559_g1724_i0:236-1564(-)
MLEYHSIGLMKQLLLSISHLRKWRVVHRDLKPDNILINKNATELCLADFGKSLDCNHIRDFKVPYLVRGFDLGGAPDYLAPEIHSSRPGPGAFIDYSNSDAWSAGRVFYSMLSRQHPFGGKYGQSITNHDIIKLPEVYSNDIQQIVYGLLKVEPRSRLTLEEAFQRLSFLENPKPSKYLDSRNSLVLAGPTSSSSPTPKSNPKTKNADTDVRLSGTLASCRRLNSSHSGSISFSEMASVNEENYDNYKSDDALHNGHKPTKPSIVRSQTAPVLPRLTALKLRQLSIQNDEELRKLKMKLSSEHKLERTSNFRPYYDHEVSSNCSSISRISSYSLQKSNTCSVISKLPSKPFLTSPICSQHSISKISTFSPSYTTTTRTSTPRLFTSDLNPSYKSPKSKIVNFDPTIEKTGKLSNNYSSCTFDLLKPRLKISQSSLNFNSSFR